MSSKKTPNNSNSIVALLSSTKALAIAAAAVFMLIITILGLNSLPNNNLSDAQAQSNGGCAATGFIPKTSATNTAGQFYQPDGRSGPNQNEFFNRDVCVTVSGSQSPIPPGTTVWNDLQNRKNYYPRNATFPSSSTSTSSSASRNIVDIATSNNDFSSLATALTKADLVNTLRGPGPFTVFAPTNSAFAKLPSATLNALLNDPQRLADLKDILTYHVVAGKVQSTDIIGTNPTRLAISNTTALNGGRLTFTTRNRVLFVNESRVTTADVQASNGVIHIIDTVLSPADGRNSSSSSNSLISSSSRSNSLSSNSSSNSCQSDQAKFQRAVSENDKQRIIDEAKNLKSRNCKPTGFLLRDYGIALADIDLNENGRLINNYINNNPGRFIGGGRSAELTIRLANKYAKEGDFDSTFKVLELYNSDRDPKRVKPTREEDILMDDLLIFWRWGFQDDERFEYFKLWQNNLYGSIDRL